MLQSIAVTTFVMGLMCLAAPSAFGAGAVRAVELKCEHLTNPRGVDRPQPRLSWILDGTGRAQRQMAYQIVAGTDAERIARGEGDLWDTGRVESAQTFDIEYAGKALASHQRVYWAVRVWDRDGQPSEWSTPATFDMGLLSPDDWTAQWIGYDAPRQRVAAELYVLAGAHWVRFAGDPDGDGPSNSHRVFMGRLEIPEDAAITRAVLYVTADDTFNFNINGKQAGTSAGRDAWRKPATIDVTDIVRPGTNDLRVGVTNEGGPTGLIARIVVTLADGRRIESVTDSSWHATDNPGAEWHVRAIADNDWPAVTVIGPHGVRPWGEISTGGLILPPASMLRGEFDVAGPVRRATLYTTALGLADMYLNGRRVSDDWFNPGWTDYAKRVYYRAYDVTDNLQPGRNAIGALLADGWYAGYVGMQREREHYGTKPRVAAQLRIEFEDGTVQMVVTDGRWKAATGPIVEADFLMGEMYDARLERKGWATAGHEAADWSTVDVGTDEVRPLLQWHPSQPVRTFEEFHPVSVNEVKPGVHILDMGQYFAGVVRLRIENATPGQRIVLRFAERLNPDGTAYTDNLRHARATDVYICRGGGVEEWMPRFTFHGFQYVEVTGLQGPIKPDTIIGVAFSSDTPVAGTFETSDPMINRLHRNIYYTQRANFIDIPTDCPQRDERLGWTADAQVYLNAAVLNADVQAFFDKWLIDLVDAQRDDGQFPKVAPLKVVDADGGPAWADAGTICPWVIYETYGDKRLLERQYPSMKRFVEFCRNRSTDDLMPPQRYHSFGDWLNIDADTPHDVIYVAYFAESTRLAAQAAEVLGNDGDARELWDLYRRIKAAFNRAFVAADGRIKGDTQTCYVLAIAFDLVDGPNRAAAERYLVENIEQRNWHLSTGFIGTKMLMNVLSDIGRHDVAYRLLHNDTFPSWGFTIRHGATSIWERWDGWTPEKGFQTTVMNSFAHYSFGAVYQWMVENIGGIRSDGIAYERIRIEPQIDPRMEWARVGYDSVRGCIATEWRKQNGRLMLNVTVPANTTATVVLPATDAAAVTEGGKPLSEAEGVTAPAGDNGRVRVQVSSGQYRFEMPLAE